MRPAAVIVSLCLLLLLIGTVAAVSWPMDKSFQATDTNRLFELFTSLHDNGGFAVRNWSNWKYRVELGQAVTGDASEGDYDAQIGYIYMLNFRPTMTNYTPSIYVQNGSLARIKHPYTNDTLVCEANVTEYDVGDIVSVHYIWYRNSSAWYNNSDRIDYNNDNISAYAARANVTFARWADDEETINVTSPSKIFFMVNTTSLGDVKPNETSHYDIWKCSVQLFDQVRYSPWYNSSPIMVFNHKPDYNTNMPTYYSWPEDTDYNIDLGSNFSDIDHDDINWYINWTTRIIGHGYVHPDNLTITINNVTGNVHIHPHANVTGIMKIVFTAVDDNHSVANGSNDWYLNNDYGQTNTSVFLLNITQVNDPPWATNVYIDPSQPSYTSTLTCKYTYNDIQNFPENTSVTSYIWYKNPGGIGNWSAIPDSNSSTLDPSNFQLNDVIKCAVRVKNIYYDWNDVDKSLWALHYTNSTYVTILPQQQSPQQQQQIVIAVG